MLTNAFKLNIKHIRICIKMWIKCVSWGHTCSWTFTVESFRIDRWTDSGTVIWYKNRCSHARFPPPPPPSPYLFVLAKIVNAFLPIYHPCRIKNERVKQPISAHVGDVMFDMCTVHRIRGTTIRSSICEAANEENCGRVTRTVTLDCSSP